MFGGRGVVLLAQFRAAQHGTVQRLFRAKLIMQIGLGEAGGVGNGGHGGGT